MINFCQFYLSAQTDFQYQVVSNTAIKVFALTSDDLNEQQIKVFVGDSLKIDQSPIVGNYFVQSDTLVFEPYFPFRYGQIYSTFINDQLGFRFEIPYPDSITFPQNNSYLPFGEYRTSQSSEILYPFFSADE